MRKTTVITDAEIAAYHRDGYAVPKGFQLNASELEVLRDALDRDLADNRDNLPARLMNVNLNGGKPYGIKGQNAFH